MSHKFFYIICRDGQIIEVRYKKETFDTIMAAWSEKGIAALKDCGVVLNGSDISKVLDENQYKNYVLTVRPREYIRNGTWYDGRDRGFLRHEPWKQAEVDEKEQLTAEDRKKILASGTDEKFPPFPHAA